MSEAKQRPRTTDEAEQDRRLPALLREAHTRLALWKTCSDDACRHHRRCGGEADGCGARVAAESWPWLRHVLAAMLAGTPQEAAVRAADFARLGIRARRTVRWHVKCWDPIEFVQLNDGTWTQEFRLPPRARRSIRNWPRATLQRWEAERLAQEQVRPKNARGRRSARRAKVGTRGGARASRARP